MNIRWEERQHPKTSWLSLLLWKQALQPRHVFLNQSAKQIETNNSLCTWVWLIWEIRSFLHNIRNLQMCKELYMPQQQVWGKSKRQMPSVPNKHPISSNQHIVDTLQLLTLAPLVRWLSHKMYFKSTKFCHYCRVLKVFNKIQHTDKMLHLPNPIKQQENIFQSSYAMSVC